MLELVSKSLKAPFQSLNTCKILVSILLPAYYKKKKKSFFLISTIHYFTYCVSYSLTWLSPVAILPLNFFVIEHNGSFIQSTLSFHGISLSGCFVRNGKCEKLFIKIILSVPTCFSSRDWHTHTQIQRHALYLQLSS